MTVPTGCSALIADRVAFGNPICRHVSRAEVGVVCACCLYSPCRTIFPTRLVDGDFDRARRQSAGLLQIGFALAETLAPSQVGPPFRRKLERPSMLLPCGSRPTSRSF